MSSLNQFDCPYENTKIQSVAPETSYNIPGIRLESFDHTIISEIKSPNCNTPLFDILSDPNLNYKTEEQISQPTLKSIFKTDLSNSSGGVIYTNIFIEENYIVPLKGSDFNIYQNFNMNLNGKYALTYYVCFKRSGEEKAQNETFRIHRFSIQSIPVYLEDSKNTETFLDLKLIEDINGFLVNVNPVTSRGTTTTVKNASGG